MAALGAGVGVAVALGGACGRERAPASPDLAAAEPAVASASVASGADSVAVPSLDPGPPARPTPLASDALWTRAAGGDPIDLERLANREGSRGLLEGFDAGGTLALTALAALPAADDAPLALGRLCAVLPRVKPAAVGPLLVAVQAIASRVPAPAERVDPRGASSCRPVLDALAASSGVAPHDRDLASSARAMLDERLGAP